MGNKARKRLIFPMILDFILLCSLLTTSKPGDTVLHFILDQSLK